MVVPKGVCLIEQGQTDCNSRFRPNGGSQRRLTLRSPDRLVRDSLLAGVGAARRHPHVGLRPGSGPPVSLIR